MDRNLVRNQMQYELFKKLVFLYNDTGSEKTFSQGKGVCFYVDFTGGANKVTGVPLPDSFDDLSDAAGDASALRSKIVREPASGQSCNSAFAGVLLDDHTLADGEGKWIEIAEPDSVCQVLTNANVNSLGTVLGCEGVDSGTEGEWPTSSKRGKGTAISLQTGDGSGTATLILAKLDTGSDTGLEDNS